MNCRKGIGLFLSLALVFFVVASSHAAEFSGDMTIQSSAGGDLTGRIFVRGNDLRQELDTPVGVQTTIINQGKGVMYVLLPGQNMYMEMPNSQVTLDEGESFEGKFSEEGKVTNLGTETVEGYLCDKWNIVYKDQSLGESTIWIARDINYPIKIHLRNPQDTATIQYSNISEADLQDDLFVLPEGYQKFSM